MLFSVLVILVVTISFTVDRKEKKSFYKPKDGFVPDKETAIKIAEIVLNKIYTEKTINHEKPFSVSLVDSSVWVVSGNLPKEYCGGVAEIEIQKSDGKIINVEHGK